MTRPGVEDSSPPPSGLFVCVSAPATGTQGYGPPELPPGLHWSTVTHARSTGVPEPSTTIASKFARKIGNTMVLAHGSSASPPQKG